MCGLNSYFFPSSLLSLRWSFESPRYFGYEHDEVKRTLTLTLRPSEVPEEVESDSDYE